LEPLQIEALHPDAFVMDLIVLAPGLVMKATHEQATTLKNPPRALSSVLDSLPRDPVP
jgi:hypothetical protein